ncbi:MAG: GNAT family N-acetyltransferase [Actinobacteria bacterium]|nr:GNAT family N-acetyltransferase [Actinomycetota bacterium]
MTTDRLPTLRGPRVTLRPATPSDLPAIRAVLDHPSVAPWWPMTDRLHDELFDERTHSFAIDVGDEIAGVILFEEETDPDYRVASIDISLGVAFQDHGLGSEAVAVLAAYLFDERGHHRITIDPAAANDRAIGAYEKIGFKPVGVMREYERDPAGGWRDALILDLLKDELRRAGGGG